MNIDEYIAVMDTSDYMRDELAIEQAVGDLPEVYKIELINRFFTIYLHEATSTTLRSNIEFCAPVLWRFLPRETKHQIGKRVDKELQSGQGPTFEQSVRFLSLVDGSLRYTTTATRQILYSREIEALEQNLDNWELEGQICARLEQLGMSIPDALLGRYVRALTHTYVGYQSYRSYYSWSAAPIIRRMFERFDDQAIEAFVAGVKESRLLKDRLSHRPQLERLRTLANTLLEKATPRSAAYNYLQLIVDEEEEKKFFATLNR